MSTLASNQLPLSWIFSTEEHAAICYRKCRKKIFIHSGQLNNLSEANFSENLVSTYGQGFILRGLHHEHVAAFGNITHQSVCLGNSALLFLNKFVPTASLSELIERGEKKVLIIEVDRCTAMDVYKKLWSHSAHRHKPVLSYLFLTPEAFQPQRYFVGLSRQTNAPLAMVSISRYGSLHQHVECLLRSRSAPVGCMEQLISTIIELLRQEGYEHFNLGEVPFLNLDPTLSRTSRERRLQGLASLCGRMTSAAYNVRGLYQFKEKFRPTWEPRYWLGVPDLNILDFHELARVSNFYKLLLQPFKRRQSVQFPGEAAWTHSFNPRMPAGPIL